MYWFDNVFMLWTGATSRLKKVNIFWFSQALPVKEGQMSTNQQKLGTKTFSLLVFPR